MARVLVVEDEPDLLDLVVAFLEDAGHAVVSARDGLEACRRLDEAVPDVMLLDLTLPGLDGWQVLDRARLDARTANLPVIVVSANAGAGERARAAHQGVRAFVAKPYDVEALVARVQSVTRTRYHVPASDGA